MTCSLFIIETNFNSINYLNCINRHTLFILDKVKNEQLGLSSHTLESFKMKNEPNLLLDFRVHKDT